MKMTEFPDDGRALTAEELRMVVGGCHRSSGGGGSSSLFRSLIARITAGTATGDESSASTDQAAATPSISGPATGTPPAPSTLAFSSNVDSDDAGLGRLRI